MRKIDQCLNKLKGAILCLVMLQTVSCWDGLNDMFEEVAGVSAITFSQSSLTSGGMSINWTDPATVTGYDHILVTYTPGGSVTLSKGDTTFNVSGLSSSTEYTVTVQAIGKEGIIKAQSSFKVTPSGVYTLSFIYTAADLDSVRSHLGDYYVVMNDIDLSGFANWTPIGTSGTPFSGILDGQGYSIKNLAIDNNTVLELGLIGFANATSIMKNSNIEGQVTGRYNAIDPCIGGLVGKNAGVINNCSSNVSVTGTITRTRAGGLVGYNSGTINFCSSAGSVKGTNDNSQTGGLVGYNTTTGFITSCSSSGGVTGTGAYYTLGGLAGTNNGTITNCYVSGNTDASGSGTGASHVGGLVGLNADFNSKITGCYSAGKLTGSLKSCRYGGLAGTNYGPITDCYAGGDVSITSVSDTYTGGLAGMNINNSAVIKNCYAKGAVVSSGTQGGLVGYDSAGIYTASYYDSQTTGQSDDTGKGFPRTTNQMKLIDTSVTTYSGWDFANVWGISTGVNGDYPYLRNVAP